MRPAFSIGRTCFRHTYRRINPHIFRKRQDLFTSFWRNGPRKEFQRPPVKGPVLLSLLTPAAFLKISEEDNGDGKTGEEHMLEASRAELQKGVSDNVHGLRRLWKTVILVVDLYIFEPLATGFRFLHLVIIFVPVIIAVPLVFIGKRQKNSDSERTGTLWWYGFLVRSMERAGPAFIKV